MRTAASRPYGTPQADLRHMLEGDVPQESDDELFVFSGGIRKPRDHNTMTRNDTEDYFNKVAPGRRN